MSMPRRTSAVTGKRLGVVAFVLSAALLPPGGRAQGADAPGPGPGPANDARILARQRDHQKRAKGLMQELLDTVVRDQLQQLVHLDRWQLARLRDAENLLLVLLVGDVVVLAHGVRFLLCLQRF